MYIPHMNQVVLVEQDQPAQTIRILAHEFSHAHVHYMQPASLYPLRCHLSEEDVEPILSNYEDIVESLAGITLPLVHDRISLTDIQGSTEGRFGSLARGYLIAARRFSRTAASTVADPVMEALHGVAILMTHVVPAKPGQAKQVLRMLKQLQLADSWSGRFDLFIKLYMAIAGSPPHESSFVLAMPIDIHRDLGDMLIFLSGALNAAVDRPGRLIGSIPSLLNLWTFGSFNIVPVISIGREGPSYRFHVNVIHSSSRAEARTNSIIDVQSNLFRQSRAAKAPCLATDLFVSILRSTTPFRISSRTTRLGECIEFLLDFMPARAKRLLKNPSRCPRCQRVFKDITIRGALSHVARMPSEHKSAMLEASSGYEEWLLTDCLKNIAGEVPFKVKKAYAYL